MAKSFISTLLVCLLTVIFATQTSAQSLLIRYTFDEASGDALDTGAPPPANGVLQPNAKRTSDTPGGAPGFALDLSAEGLESFVNAGDVAKVDTLTSFTLTTWLKLEGLNSEQGGSGNVRLLAKQAGGPAFNGISWNLNNPNEGDRGIDNFKLGLFVGGEDSFAFGQSTDDIGAENWTFLAATYDGTADVDNVSFYVGDEVNPVMPLGDLLAAPAGRVASTAGEADFGIGFTDAAPDTDFAVVGFQDDVRVYDGVLAIDQLEAARLENLGAERLQAGDADQDLDFDQFDLIQVQQAGKYLTGQPATWGDGDWDAAPGGRPGEPPIGNGLFDQLDIIAALNSAVYLTGPYAAVAPGGLAQDAQTSVGYDPLTGELFVDAPAGTELTSINIDSAGGVFTGEAAGNLGGSFDNDADSNIFKATFGGSFGSLSFGNVAQSALSQDFLLNDLTVVGSLAGGGDLGAVDLIYVPEPAAYWLLLSALIALGLIRIR